MLVKDIMDRSYPSLYADELATKARAILRETGIRILPVIDDEHRLIGIVTRSDLMTITSSVSPIRVQGIMSQPRFTATLNMPAEKAVRQMLKLDEWYSPVVKSEQERFYMGVLGLENYVSAVINRGVEALFRPISEIMSTNVVTCSPEDEIDNVWRIMMKKSFAGLPVVKKGRVVGIITQKDLLDSGAAFPGFEAKRGRFKSPPKVASVMRVPVITLKPNSLIREAAKLIIEKNIGRIPIVNDKGELVGIVDREDIVKALLGAGG